MFLLPLENIYRPEKIDKHLIWPATSHRLFLKQKYEQRFSGIAISSIPAVVDCLLRFRELFDAMCVQQRPNVNGSPGPGPGPGKFRDAQTFDSSMQLFETSSDVHLYTRTHTLGNISVRLLNLSSSLASVGPPGGKKARDVTSLSILYG